MIDIATFLLARLDADELTVISSGGCACTDGLRPDCLARILDEIRAKRLLVEWASDETVQLAGSCTGLWQSPPLYVHAGSGRPFALRALAAV